MDSPELVSSLSKYELNPHESSTLPRLASVEVDPGDVAVVLRALALAWTPRQRNWLIAFLRELGQRTVAGTAFGQPQVDACLIELVNREEVMRSEAGWQCLVRHKTERYRQAVLGDDFPRWRDAMMRTEGIREHRSVVYFQRDNQAITLARLIVYGGGNIEQWRALQTGSVGLQNTSSVLDQVMLSGFDPELFDRADRGLAAGLLALALQVALRDIDPNGLAPLRYARQWVERHGSRTPLSIRARVVEWLMFSAHTDEADQLAQGVRTGEFAALRAAILATRGQWREAVAAYDEAFAQIREEASTRKGIISENTRWLYPMCLFGTRDAQHIATARKFALTEAGGRRVEVDTPWGLWAAAAETRLGDRPRDPSFASFHGWHATHLHLNLVARRMLQAWAVSGQTPPPAPGSSQALAARLRDCELWWLLDQVEAADQVLAGKPTSKTFFASGGHESWREALAAIAALGQDSSSDGLRPSGNDTQLLWVMSVDRHHRLTQIEPYERKRGPRGWGKPKAVPLSRLARAATLDPHDARVARAIKADRRFGTHRPMLDLMDAAAALVGHPHVVFDDALDQPVTLVEALPDVRVVEEDEHWRLTFDPDLGLAFDRPAQAEVHIGEPGRGGESRAPEMALRTQFVVRDATPEDVRAGHAPATMLARARLIRLTPAHRRVYELSQSGLRVPRSAANEIQSVLPVLSAHFRLTADAVQGARQVEARAGLRAELSRRGERYGLRLMAAPLGPGGPRLVPGHGREEVVAMVDGQLLGTRRSLEAELAAANAIIEHFDFLDVDDEDTHTALAQAPEWTLRDPQQVLLLLEVLPTLPQIDDIDWPEGQRIAVQAVGEDGLKVKVRADGHWFRVDGQVKVDEQRVVELGRLIEWIGKQHSRYVPIGDGKYLALTDSLRQRIEDLARVGEPARRAPRVGTGAPEAPDEPGETVVATSAADATPTAADAYRIPDVAALWLGDVLDQVDVEADAAFIARTQRLRDLPQTPMPLPASLQTELRPYQLDGYHWMMQRAQAGVGACLADDMGLGKTIQSLAVILARAEHGPTLVVAPTSVCGNWVAEATRFAPSLRVRAYGASERAEGTALALGGLGPNDLIVVSYTMLQQSEQAFAAIEWATLVVDEAQAVKNASAKRSKAVAGLSAQFRLALSGTPIENRLSELWSIMNIVNPGLLGSAKRFAQRFVLPIERARDLRAQRTLRRLIGPFVLRRIKAEVLEDLPPRTEVTLTVQPTEQEAAFYEALRREALQIALVEGASAPGSAKPAASADEASARFHVLAQLTKLRRAACDPRLVSPELGVTGAKTPAFIELVSELVANRHKALVFSQFVDFLQMLRDAVEQAGLRYQYLDGSTPAAERQARVDAFQQGDGDLFFISLKAGGFGLNLTAADYVVIVDPWWNPAAEDQAMGRAHRIGQQRPVTVYRLVMQQTIEQRIVELHHDKRSLAEGVLDDIDSGTALSLDDMVGLLDDPNA